MNQQHNPGPASTVAVEEASPSFQAVQCNVIWPYEIVPGKNEENIMCFKVMEWDVEQKLDHESCISAFIYKLFHRHTEKLMQLTLEN